MKSYKGFTKSWLKLIKLILTRHNRRGRHRVASKLSRPRALPRAFPLRFIYRVSETIDISLFPGSSDEGESTSGATTGGGGGGENAEMEENGSTRASSNSGSNNPVYRDLKPLQAGGAHEIPQDYNPQSRSAYHHQRGYSPGMDRQRSYEKEHQPSPSGREEERKSAWDYSEKSARKDYSRSRDYGNEYRESHNSAEERTFGHAARNIRDVYPGDSSRSNSRNVFHVTFSDIAREIRDRVTRRARRKFSNANVQSASVLTFSLTFACPQRTR